MLLYWPKLLYPYYSLLLFFPILFFLSIGWYCGAGVFGLIGCIPLSLSLALPTFFNNNNNNKVGCSLQVYVWFQYKYIRTLEFKDRPTIWYFLIILKALESNIAAYLTYIYDPILPNEEVTQDGLQL